MQFLPRSLFGRLVLVFTGGLTLALALSLALNVHERRHLIAHEASARLAEHLAIAVRLLDRLAPRDRRSVVRVLSGARHTVSLGGPPLETPGEDRLPTRAQRLSRALHAALGPTYPLRVLPPGPGRGRRGAGVAVQLHDGVWVRFENQHSPAPPHWPLMLFTQLGVLLFLAVLVSLYAVSRVTRPLALFASAARALGRDIRRHPLPETGPTEVRRAAEAFNLMQRRLVRFLDSRLHMLTAISHDLRTPLTRLRLRAELLDDENVRRQINADLDEMDAMLKGTLSYLRGEARGEQVQAVDVDALVQTIAADAQELGQPVSCTTSGSSAYPARPHALRRCLDNLVQNALRYGGSAQITVEERPGALTIRVADRGPGLPESELERVFEPFYRTERSRNRETGGTGLGLAIARDIAEAHGGTLRLANRSSGGLEAIISLPR